MSIKKFIWHADSDDVAFVQGEGIFKGQVLENNEPVPDAQLEIYAAIPQGKMQNVRTDKQGYYQVQLPPGTYFVHIRQPDRVQVDAAVARPVNPAWLNESIIGIGVIRGTTAADVGLTVQKSGRSTGLTRGQVTVIGTSVTVGFSKGRSARFTNQIVTTKMGAPGDSGSLLVDLNNHAVGLLFAGGQSATIYHPISDVAEQLNVRLQKEKTVLPVFHYSAGRYRDLQALSETKSDELLSLPHVIGVGVGHKHQSGLNRGEPCITVLVDKKIPLEKLNKEDVIPAVINGFITDVIETGELRAETGDSAAFRLERKGKIRPARPGVSVGHYQISAGTLGAVVYDNLTDEPLILSNNHVLANATDGTDGFSQTGDPILQPGQADGGLEPEDIVARLLRYYPLNFL